VLRVLCLPVEMQMIVVCEAVCFIVCFSGVFTGAMCVSCVVFCCLLLLFFNSSNVHLSVTLL
ncbi:hypothetical protein NDU88_001839, partial [Pleurodeles waltl]